QIDVATKTCVGISYLSGEVIGDHMILLSDTDEVNLHDIYNEDGTWAPASQLTSKQVKIDELNAACNDEILAGFTSSALGTANSYDFDYEAQTNLGGMLNAITAGIITTEPISWK